jgi:hypothetical protein
VPALAAGLADVGVRDDLEAVGARVEQHRLDAAPRRVLALGAGGLGRADVAEPGGEGVARVFELGQREEPRAGGAGAGRTGRVGRRRGVRPRRADLRGELALELRKLVEERVPCRRLRRDERDVDENGHVTLRLVLVGWRPRRLGCRACR